MVDKTEKVSGTSASAPTRVETSVSLSEPEAAWVAERQSIISSELAKRAREETDGPSRDDDVPERASGDGHLAHHSPGQKDNGSEELLSGESERIGTGNLDEDVPFGDHVGFV
ncbi:hypothetical protein QTL95_15915 [Rhizobium sp. S152]|uniref:hypothetical protein n=1 Tax=Rhizobium sp. S152 TaxID=3055038 RepID=UPI0025A9FF28|nr:hypothetical protein [Rhizobium sp. S152]MDM9627395.1 hypothetical protein [Rhizobium sp. S152]